MFVIAHLSDLHLDGTPAARDRLRRVTSYLRSLSRPVDAVLVTGDLADHGSEYAEVAAELDVEPPVLVLPGNHDVSAPLRAGLQKFLSGTGPEAGQPVHQVCDVAGARFVLLDTSVPGEDHGLLSAESLAWLRGALAPPAEGPVFVAFHHPPVEIGHPVLDGWRLRDSAGFAEVLRKVPSVTALLAGHVHGAVVSTLPGPRC